MATIRNGVFKPYTALCTAKSKKKSTAYYIRFSPACVAAFGGAKRCYLMKTENESHIVIQPITFDHIPDSRTQLGVTYAGKASKGAMVYCTGRVTRGFLKAKWFDGTHYAVKKDKKGLVYICLNEPLKEDSEDDG
jgi:hypothetical protein